MSTGLAYTHICNRRLFMRELISITVFFVCLTAMNVANADVFDIPSSSSWTKVQDGEVTQWSVIPPNMLRTTRIDLVSYVDESGVRVSYYVIRRACQSGKIELYTVKPGNKLGVGLDCDMDISMTYELSAMLNLVDKLPTEAKTLLP